MGWGGVQKGRLVIEMDKHGSEYSNDRGQNLMIKETNYADSS